MMGPVRRVLLGGLILLGLLVGACVRPGSGTPATRPVLAAAPQRPLSTPMVVLARTGATGLTQRTVVRPDGEWLLLAPPGSVRASVVNDGRLDPARHAELARLLSEAAAQPGEPSGDCPAGVRYRLDAGPLYAAWTGCDAPDRPALTAIVDLLGAATAG